MTKEQMASIENSWKSRCDTQGYGKKAAISRQADFFAGAMAMAVAMSGKDGSNMPPRWVIGCLCGGDIRTLDPIS